MLRTIAAPLLGFRKSPFPEWNSRNRAVRRYGSSSLGTELGNLETSSSGTTQSFAYAVNSSGTAVGHSTKYVSGVYYGDQAVRWDASSTTAIESGAFVN